MAIEQTPERSFGGEAAGQELPPIEDLVERAKLDDTYADGRNANDTVGRELWSIRQETAQEIEIYRASLTRIDEADEQGIDPTFRDLMVRKLEESEALLYFCYGY